MLPQETTVVRAPGAASWAVWRQGSVERTVRKRDECTGRIEERGTASGRDVGLLHWRCFGNVGRYWTRASTCSWVVRTKNTRHEREPHRATATPKDGRLVRSALRV